MNFEFRHLSRRAFLLSTGAAGVAPLRALPVGEAHLDVAREDPDEQGGAGVARDPARTGVQQTGSAQDLSDP